MRIDVWSDIVCPWCYLGERRLEAAIGTLGWDDEVEVHLRAFQLDPSASAEPGELRPAIERKYGPGAFDAMVRRLTDAGGPVGIDFHFETSFLVERLTEFVPSRIPHIVCKSPCYYTETADNEYIFKEESDKVLYCFGFNGTGFKHGPYHGKRIWHLLKGDAEGHKYCGKKGCHNQSKCPNANPESLVSPRL